MKKYLIAMMAYVVLFGIVFLLSTYSYFNSIRIIEIAGLPSDFIDVFVALLSFGGLVKSIWHLFRF